MLTELIFGKRCGRQSAYAMYKVGAANQLKVFVQNNKSCTNQWQKQTSVTCYLMSIGTWNDYKTVYTWHFDDYKEFKLWKDSFFKYGSPSWTDKFKK